jgi:hypothetical protein
VLKNVLKWRAFTPAFIHSSTPIQVSLGKMPTKITKGRTIKSKEKSPWSVLTSSPIIQKKKPKATIGRIITRKWFTIRTPAILIKMMGVIAVNNVRNTTM